MTTQREDPQEGMFDVTIVDKELFDACRGIDNDKLAAKRYAQNATLRRTKIKAMSEQMQAVEGFEESGARIRVQQNEEDPGYVLVVKPRSGGGFEVGEWHSVGVSSQAKVE